MSSLPSDLDALAQREAFLLRLNDEINADSRAVISDAERYLRDPLPASKATHTLALSRPNTASNDDKVRRPASSTSNNIVDRRSSRYVTSSGILSASRDVIRGAISERGSWKRGERVRSSAAGKVHEAQERCKADVVAASRAGTPSFECVSDRVKRAATGSGGRGGKEETVPSSRLCDNTDYPAAGGSSARSTRQQLSFGMKDLQQNSSRGESGDGEHTPDGSSADIGTVPSGIGEEATARFLKAKLSACQSQLEEALTAHQTLHQDAMESRKRAALEQEDARRLSRQLQQLQQANEKNTKAKNDEAANSATLSARVLELERELGRANRSAKASETEKKSLDVRLHRALEEITKLKELVREARDQGKDSGQGQRLEVSRLGTQCQRLERQKMELLSAFKKQLKLIDVLKRQKFHVEAARLLAFTEEDFIKSLDWMN